MPKVACSNGEYFPGVDLNGPKTMVPNFFLDHIMADLSGVEFLVALAIFRLTSGEGVVEAPISLREFSRITGCRRKQTLIEAIRGLRDRGYVFTSGEQGQVRSYRFVGMESPDAFLAAEKYYFERSQVRKALEPPRVDLRKLNPISFAIRLQVFRRDQVCQHCGGEDRLQVDHIRPLAKGGDSSLENLQLLCIRCNARKGNRWEP